MSKTGAVVAGHICIDITPLFPAAESASGGRAALGDLLVPGSLLRMNGVDIHTGGAVANTGLAMRKFGVDASLMGKVGRDAFGSMILDILRLYGAEKGMIVSDDASTSYSVVIAAPGCDRVFLHDPGANDHFYFADLDLDTISNARLFHLGYPPIMASLFRNGGDELARIFRTIDGMGVMTSLDLAAVDEDSEAGAVDWEAILERTLPFTDFFFPSFEELAWMIDRTKYAQLKRRSGGDIIGALSVEDDVRPLAEKAIALGAKVAIVKCGARGFYYRTAGEQRLAALERKHGASLEAWRDKRGFEKSYVPAKVLSATGAGDTTIAAFLSAMLQGRPFGRCLQLAAAAGASCVEAYDALGGLKTFEELESKIESGWAKTGDERCL